MQTILKIQILCLKLFFYQTRLLSLSSVLISFLTVMFHIYICQCFDFFFACVFVAMMYNNLITYTVPAKRLQRLYEILGCINNKLMDKFNPISLIAIVKSSHRSDQNIAHI